MLKNKLLRGILSVGVIQIANYIFPLITVPIVSRIIGPERYGTVNFAFSFVNYFVLFIGYGYDLTAVRRVLEKPNDEDHRNQVFSEVFFSQLFLFIVSTVLFLIFLYLIPQLREEKLVAIFTFSMCVGTLFTQNWLFQAMHDLPKIAILNLVSKIGFTVLILLTIHHKSDYIWQPFAVSITAILTSLVSFFWSIIKYNLKLKYVKLRVCLEQLWNDKAFFLSMIIISLYTTTNVVILGFVGNQEQVGYYAAGQRLIAIFQSVITMTLSQAFFPFISRAFNESFQRGLEVAQRLMPIILLFTGLVGIFFVVVAPTIVHILFGAAFTQAIVVFRILAFTPLIIAFSTVAGIHVMMNLKMDNLFFKISCVGAVFSIPCNLLLAKKFGEIGSAVSLISTECLVALLFYVLLRKKDVDVINYKYFGYKSILNDVFFFRK